MTATKTPFGLSCALTIPFRDTLEVDLQRLVAHARDCLREGCASITVFGTTGEGASLGMPARQAVLRAMRDAGLDLRQQVAGGVAAAAMHDSIDQTRLLLDNDCRAILLAPPFYFKGVGDEGLFRWFAHVFEKLGADARDVILYNIPSVTAVPLSIELIDRLRTAFPEVITAVKDSSGDWAYTERLLAAHSDLHILIGDERSLGAGMRLGASGAISGLANVYAGELGRVIAERRDDPRMALIVEEVLRFPVTPAVKALVAHKTGDGGWLAVRPPLVALDHAAAIRLAAACDRILEAKAA